jgi:cyclopropane fatty-acyl-phospholipid synthase-like methyltransferase
MKQLLVWVSLLLLFACSGEQQKKQGKNDTAAMEKNTRTHHSNGKKGSANEYMHQSSNEELIKRFESKERDEYQKPEKVLDFLGDLEGKTIVDIGAGSGYFSVKLADKAEKVIAADVDQEFLNYIQKRIEKNELKNIETRKIPYDSPLLKDSEVDMIFIVNTYHHIENRSDYFAKAKKGLKENGELVIIDFFKSESPVGPPLEMKIAIDEVVADLKKAGYTTFEAETNLLPYQYILKAK